MRDHGMRIHGRIPRISSYAIGMQDTRMCGQIGIPLISNCVTRVGYVDILGVSMVNNILGRTDIPQVSRQATIRATTRTKHGMVSGIIIPMVYMGVRGKITSVPVQRATGEDLPHFTSALSVLFNNLRVMGNTESVVPVIVQDTGMIATQEEYHTGSVVRSVGIALGLITLIVLGGIACKHYGIFRCLTQASQPAYNNNNRRDSYFLRYISRGGFRSDVENQPPPAMILPVHPPPPPVYISPVAAPPGYTPTKSPPASSSGLSGAEQYAML